MTPEKILIKSKEELEKMPTKQLITRLRRLLGCENNFESSDLAYDDNKDPDELFPNFINYKDTKKWENAYEYVKNILSKREHIIKGFELRKIRLENIKINQTKEKNRLVNKGKKYSTQH